MRIFVNVIIRVVALAAVCWLFLFFRHDNMTKEVQSSSVRIVSQTSGETGGAPQGDTAQADGMDDEPQSDDVLEEAEIYNYTGYSDITLQMDNGVISQTVKMYMKGDKCYFFLPACASSYKFTMQYPEDRYTINMDNRPVGCGSQITYGDIAKQHMLEIATYDDFVPYSLEFMQSENLPVIFIETANGTMEYVNQAKTNKEAGEMTCILVDGSVDSTGTFSIHARGSASFEAAAKKQYKMNLDEAVDILSMGKGNAWILQANALDSTRIRNNLSYEFARNIQLRYAVDSMYADVYFNGEYGGNYLVCEPIEFGENRIAADGESSYLLAIDRVSAGDDSFTDQYGQTFDIRHPQENTPKEVEELRTWINDIEELIDTCDTWEEYQQLSAYIDIDSFVNMYLMNTIMNETDANGASYYFYIDGDGGKLYAGPAWDYDRAWGNSKNIGSYRFNVYQNGIPERLATIPYFMQDIQNKLQDSKEALAQLRENVTTMSNMLRTSVNMEKIVYGDTNRGFVDTGDYDADIAFLKFYVENRIEWVSNILFHQDIYHRVFINIDQAEVTYWVKDGETIPADDLDYIYEIHHCDSLIFANGEAFWDGYPVLSDIVLYGCMTEETADVAAETIVEKTDGENAEITAEKDKGMHGMGLLAFIIILTPGFIVLFISIDRNDEKNISRTDLLIRYFCYDFLILLFMYGSVYCTKGAITLSLSDAVDSSFDYSIYNVNVVFLLMVLEMTGACALGCGIRVYKRVVRKPGK